MAARLGRLLGEYRLLHWLGMGRFAQVYLGEHHHYKQPVVIKVFRIHLTLADQVYFWAEARALSRLAHTHLVHIRDFDVVAGSPMLVMEFAPQGTLQQHHPSSGPLDLAQVNMYVQQLAGALAAAHAAQIIHGQLTPHQVLVGSQSELLLSDFAFPSLQRQWQVAGVPPSREELAYLAPEQCQGYASPASDQYALGIMVYEWLTGQRPFQGAAHTPYRQHAFVVPPALRLHHPSVPLSLEVVVQRALATDPQDRFPSIQHFAEAVAHATASALQQEAG